MAAATAGLISSLLETAPLRHDASGLWPINAKICSPSVPSVRSLASGGEDKAASSSRNAAILAAVVRC